MFKDEVRIEVDKWLKDGLRDDVNWNHDVSHLLEAITKLVEGLIGKDEGLLPAKDFNDGRLTSQDYALLTENRLGYNRAKAELRKKVENV